MMKELFDFVTKLKKLSKNIKITLASDLDRGGYLIIEVIYYIDMCSAFGRKITITKDLVEDPEQYITEFENHRLKILLDTVYNVFSHRIVEGDDEIIKQINQKNAYMAKLIELEKGKNE